MPLVFDVSTTVLVFRSDENDENADDVDLKGAGVAIEDEERDTSLGVGVLIDAGLPTPYRLVRGV